VFEPLAKGNSDGNVKLLRQLLVLFSPGEKTMLGLFVILNLFCSLLELLGIGAVLPVIMLLTDPGAIQRNWYLKKVYELFSAGSFPEFMIELLVGIVGFFLVKNLFMFAVYIWQQRFLERTYEQMTENLMRGYLEKPYAYFNLHPAAEILRNIQAVQQVVLGMLTPGLILVSEVLTVGVLTVFLLWVNPGMTLMLGLLLGTLLLAGLRMFKRKTLQLGQVKTDADKAQIGNILQGFGGIREIRLLGLEDFILRRSRPATIRLGNSIKTANILGIFPRFYIEILAIFGVFALLIVMLKLGIKETAIVVEISIFAMAAARLMPSATRIGMSINNIRIFIPPFNYFYDDMVAVKQRPSLPKEFYKPELLPFDSAIELQNVSFSYRPETPLFERISLRIEKNRKIGLVGPSGSGKSTLVDLIVGLLSPTRGAILVDGNHIQDHLANWRANIGYIPQQIFVFDDTVRGNVALGLAPEAVDEERLWEVLRIAQLENVVRRLPGGVDALLGAGGTQLSGGERQRLGIARALYRDPAVLVMDEATSALDHATEEDFLAAVDTLAGRKTLIIIAHRLTALRSCDKIYRIEHGQISEEKQ